MRRAYSLLAALALTAATARAALVSSAPAAGPSFECAKAVGDFEKSVCADPVLAQGDRDMAAAWRQTLARTAPAWRARLVQSQRSWIAFAAATCLSGDLPRMAGGETVASCRRKLFEDRVKALKATFTTQAGRRLITLTTYSAKRVTDEELPRTATFETALTQIERPANAAERRWNAVIDQRLSALAKDETFLEGSAGVVFESTAPGFIGVTLNRTDMRGPGGDSISLHSVLWSLKLNRELTAADLFTHPSAAKAAIAALALRHIREDAAKAGDPLAPDAITGAQYRTLVDRPEYWSLTAKGLSLSPDDNNDFGGAHFALTGLAGDVPWGELKPYLKKNLPVDLGALKDAN
jgi:uncharacterized protein YecT (DUF1311 family)